MQKIILNLKIKSNDKKMILEDLKYVEINNFEIGDIIYLESGFSYYLGYNLRLVYKDQNKAIFWAIRY